MAVEIVNGVPCFNCTEVERAQKNAKAGIPGLQDPNDPQPKTVQDVLRQQDRVQERGINLPLANGPIGTRINIYS